MREVPSTSWVENGQGQPSEDAPLQAEWSQRGEVKHIFTHFELRLAVYETQAALQWEPEEGDWVSEADLADQALPSVMRKVLAQRSVSD